MELFLSCDGGQNSSEKPVFSISPGKSTVKSKCKSVDWRGSYVGIYQSILVWMDEGIIGWESCPILYHVDQSCTIDLFITIIFYCY